MLKLWKIVPLALMFVVLLAVPAFAQQIPGDWGPPPGPFEVSCVDHRIDPPEPIIVTAVVTLDGGTPSTQQGVYAAEVPNFAVFPWSAEQLAILNVPGPHAYHIVYTWTFGTGETVSEGEIQCVEIPETTTTTTSDETTTTTSAGSTTTAAPGQLIAGVGSATGGGTLPNTGSSGDLLMPAGVAVAAGASAIIATTRRRRRA